MNRKQSTKKATAKNSKRKLPADLEARIRAKVDEDAAAAAPLALEAYASAFGLYLNHPAELTLARRVTDLYATASAKGRHALGERVSELLDRSDEADIFAPDFQLPALTIALRDAGDTGEAADLRKIVERVDSGETLDGIAAADEQAEKDAEREMRERPAPELSQPEPKDKTSRDWRIWKLRHIEAGFDAPRDSAEWVQAWRDFDEFFEHFAGDSLNVTTATAILPSLIIAWQDSQKREGKAKRRK
jgi:hypothetical protein